MGLSYARAPERIVNATSSPRLSDTCRSFAEATTRIDPVESSSTRGSKVMPDRAAPKRHTTSLPRANTTDYRWPPRPSCAGTRPAGSRENETRAPNDPVRAASDGSHMRIGRLSFSVCTWNR